MKKSLHSHMMFLWVTCCVFNVVLPFSIRSKVSKGFPDAILEFFFFLFLRPWRLAWQPSLYHFRELCETKKPGSTCSQLLRANTTIFFFFLIHYFTDYFHFFIFQQENNHLWANGKNPWGLKVTCWFVWCGIISFACWKKKIAHFWKSKSQYCVRLRGPKFLFPEVLLPSKCQNPT